MKRLFFVVVVVIFSMQVYSQASLADKLAGTWKSNQGEVYEQWQKLDERHCKGVSWYFQQGLPVIMEYLDLIYDGQSWNLCASVPGQNNGNRVCFSGKDVLNGYIFENPQHDFPKQISYLFVSENKLSVTVTGDTSADFSMTMDKIFVNSEAGREAYDERLANQLGADAYGMKKYIFVLLKSGSRPVADTMGKALAFRGHLNNIRRLSAEKKLIIAGPFFRNEQDLRGIFVFNTTSIEEAQQWLATDPAISGGWLEPIALEWYGSAALPLYLDFVDKITREKF